MTHRAISELEGSVLGIVALEQAVTAYAVARMFSASPSPQWSGSAGAIYPLVSRLQRAGLLRAVVHRTGRRPSKLLSLTPSGLRALRAWFGGPVPDRIGGVPPDPLRTRIRFLGLLPPAQQRAFMGSARRSAERNLSVVRRDCEQWRTVGGPRYFIAKGALMMMEARCEWIRDVERSVKAMADRLKRHARDSGRAQPRAAYRSALSTNATTLLHGVGRRVLPRR
jgi:DNA-binding PadR family transcriptional regulator